MPSALSRILPGYLRLTRAKRIYRSADEARKHVEERRIRPLRYAPPRGLRRDVSISVETGEWPIYTLAPQGRTSGSVVYLHGGGWVNEIQVQHWRLAAQIAAEARTRVVVPIYPLVPFGTSAQVVAAVAGLVAGLDGPHCLAGDSAGGQIALSAALLLRDERHLIASRTVLISPGLDLTLTNPEINRVQPRDPWLARDGMRVFIDGWRGNLPVADPLISPAFADLGGLGPLTVFSGTRDILNPDTRLFVDRARLSEVDVDYHEAPGLVHVYPLTPTPEGRAARALIVDRLRTAIA